MYATGLPKGTYELLHALRVCGVLHMDQARIILKSSGIKRGDIILAELLERKILYAYASYISVKPLRTTPTKKETAAMWVYLEFIARTKDNYSKGMYPAQIIFPYGKYSLELVVLGGDVNVEIGHIYQRERPKIPTKYIFVFYDEASKEMVNYDLLPPEECYFATLIFPDQETVPTVMLEKMEEES